MDLDPAVALTRDARPDLLVLYVFGSQATGDARPESDVDLALLARSPLDPVERWKLQERLAHALHRDVDLVDLRATTTVMRAQVLRTAIVLFEADANERARFEMHALSAYARFNGERRGILEDVKRRGCVHG